MSADFNSTTHPVARKPHRCEECGRTVEPGETYDRTAAVWEGEFFTNLACAHCSEARRFVDRYDGWYNESYYGGLSEWLGDHWFDDVWTARLFARIRAKWRYQSGALMPVPDQSQIPPVLRRAS